MNIASTGVKFADMETSSVILEKINTFIDPRVESYLFMDSFLPTFLICFCYIVFVLWIGPAIMKKRKPFSLRPVLIVYNAAQTLFSGIFFCIATYNWINVIGFQCYKFDTDDTSPGTLYCLKLTHIYYLSKLAELCDTVFFVLKKKERHVSFLHVFHHAIMPVAVWAGIKFKAGGNLTFFGLPNLFVHTWMYLYYLAASLGEEYQKYIWWKKHITEMQLAQFALVMLYMIYISTTCTTNNAAFVYLIYVLDVIFIYLFVNFYRQAYKSKKE